VVKEFQARGIKCRINAPGSKQGVAEGSEQINEYRDRLLQYVKSLLPTWPEYVLKDWLVPNKGNFSNLPADAVKNGIMKKVQGAGLTPNSKWQLVPNMKFTMDMFDPKTKQLLIGRAGGSSDLSMGIPKDKERHATQAALAQQQGGVRKEPVLLIKTAKGYELLEGWHRTIQHFVKYPEGYTGPAYVAVAQGQQGVAEGSDNPWGDQGNFAGDTPVNIGGATVKPIQVGDTVTYLGQRAKILAQSKDRKHSRITIAKGMGGVVQTVLTSDLKRTGLKEFSPPNGNNGDSGRWYTDGELADIIGDDWFEDFDVSNDGFNIDTHGEKSKQNLAVYANTWFDDKGYNVNVLGVDNNDVDHDLKWYIVGSFQNDNFAKKDVDEGTDNVVHRIGLTVTDPNHPMVSKRGETIQKTVRVTGGNQEQAINRAIAHHRKKGYKVHDHHYIGTADSPVQEEGPGPGQETGFGAEGSKKLGTVNTELISRAWRENRPNVVLTFGNSGEYRLDRGMIRYLLGYYKSLPDDNSKWYFIYETMSRLEKLVALLEKANLPNSEIPAAGQQELDLTEKKRPKDDLSSAGARDADVQRALQRARAATPTASSDMGALVKQDLQTQEKTQQKLADIEADNQRQMDMLKKNDSVNVDQQRAIRSLERQVSKVPGATAPAKTEPTPAPKKSAVAPVAPAVEPARIPPMARPRPTIGNKVPADVSIPSISLPPLPDPSTAVQSPNIAVQNPNIAVQNPTRLQIPAPSQGQQTILPAMTPQPASQYNTTDAVDVDFRHLGAAPNLDNFDEPEEPQKRTGTYGEGIQETANDMVKFSIDGERAYDAVMDRFGHVIDWSDDSMTAPRKFWPRIEELAHDFGGEASEEGSDVNLGYN